MYNLIDITIFGLCLFGAYKIGRHSAFAEMLPRLKELDEIFTQIEQEVKNLKFACKLFQYANEKYSRLTSSAFEEVKK